MARAASALVVYPTAPQALADRFRLWPAVLLFLFAVLPNMLHIAFTSVLMVGPLVLAALWWLLSGRRLERELVMIVLPFAALIVLGLVSASGHQTYEILKDVWYVANVPLVILSGYILMWNLGDVRRMYRIVVIAAVFMALLHILPFVIYPQLLELAINDIRALVGRGYFITGLALPLMLGAWRHGVTLFGRARRFEYVLFAVCLVSVSLSFSRTMIISIGLILISLWGFLDPGRQRQLGWVLGVCAALVLADGLLPTQEHVGQDASIAEKFLYSMREVKIQDYRMRSDINQNWRGYESSRAVATFASGNLVEQGLGQGFGQDIDLGLYIPLGAEKIRYAPILHNGYLYVLVKTGVAGLFCYLAPLVWFGFYGRRASASDVPEVRMAGRLVVGLCLTFAFTTFVTGGLFNKNDLVGPSLVFGALVAWLQRVQAPAVSPLAGMGRR